MRHAADCSGDDDAAERAAAVRRQARSADLLPRYDATMPRSVAI